MTTAELVQEMHEIERRHPKEKEVIARLVAETQDRTKIALSVERALHDAIKILEKGF